MNKTVAIVATLDTKGRQVAFVRKLLTELGVNTIVVDAGILTEPRTEPDISREQVAEAAGVPLEDIRRRGRQGVVSMAEGAAKIVADIYHRGGLDGFLGMGGGQNTAIASTVAQALPLGVPKLIVSTVASGNMTFGPYVGTSDVTLMHSVADVAGDNAIISRVLTNAARAIAGMVQDSDRVRPSGRKTIAATMLGVTTPCVERATALLEKLGYEVVIFHASGTGGRSMEELVRSGFFHGVLDLTTHELSDHMYGGLMGSPGRLEAAAEMGIPQVVAPGGIEMISQGPLESISPAFSGRPILIHNTTITSVRLNEDEMRNVARVVAERLNASCGEVGVVLPLKGFCEFNRPGQPLYGPEADAAFVDTLRQHLRKEITVIELDNHMNDPVVADTAVELMHRLMQSHYESRSKEGGKQA